MWESYSIIPDSKKLETGVDVNRIKAAVLVHLFYEDQVESNKEYLERLPDCIDIIILSSNRQVLDRFSGNRYIKIKKENRGRDISALLVTAKPIIFEYQYICFVHDKKEKSLDDKEYVDLWKQNMWDNMLQSPAYVYNILDAFENDSKMGIMVPLPPHQGDKGVWLKGDWGGTFEIVRNLADEIGLSVDIGYDTPPITYSTVFWARTKVLQKLFTKEWTYTDFPDEPMRDYGEINHAVERILQYVTEDAGYKTQIVLSSTFASQFILQLKAEMGRIWNQMNDAFGVRDNKDIENYGLRVEKIRRFKEKHSEIYLYGAGKAGRDCLKMCALLGIEPVGILVTDIGIAYTDLEGVKIVPVSEFIISGNAGVIITAYETVYRDEISKVLDRIGFHEYIVF